MKGPKPSTHAANFQMESSVMDLVVRIVTAGFQVDASRQAVFAPRASRKASPAAVATSRVNIASSRAFFGDKAATGEMKSAANRGKRAARSPIDPSPSRRASNM
jgi:hypothetical protein